MPTATRPRPPADGGAASIDGGTAAELIDLVSGLRRSVRRRVRRDWSHRPLTPSELELLMLVGERPGLRVREAASAIGVAPNTVSTLVGRLTAQGLLDRLPDEEDARAARLSLTAAATRRRDEWRDRRRDVVGAAMRDLAAADRSAIGAAVPALRRLLAALEEDAR
jgi:DNA-binding MarR family transcriptional regulator